jgi:hypothetical protein
MGSLAWWDPLKINLWAWEPLPLILKKIPVGARMRIR